MKTDTLAKLRSYIKKYQRVAIGFSGGVDSTFLTAVATDVLGRDNVLACTVRHELMAPHELRRAKRVARQLSFQHSLLTFSVLSLPRIRKNSPERCYYCKKAIFKLLNETVRPHGFNTMYDGTNHDDLFSYRPGNRAGEEAGLVRPLAECGITKKEIRIFSQRLQLPTWDDPSSPCLATRFAYGRELCEEDLHRLARSEQYIRSLGFLIVRLRVIDDGVRIEVSEKDIPILVDPKLRKKISLYLRRQGYRRICLDLDGYRSGSMDESRMKKSEKP